MLASPEFIALCQSQVAVLTQGFGASLSVVYLAEHGVDEALTDLVPIAAHPEIALTRDRSTILSLLSTDGMGRSVTQSSTPADLPGLLPTEMAETSHPSEDEVPESDSATLELAIPASERMMLPMVHDDVVVGVLVTARSDRPWQDRERDQIENIANTLAIAFVLDHRASWSDHALRQLEQLQEQQNEVLDNLLHQLGSPLTALRTFGELLMKRLRTQDQNREFVEGVLRETQHMQELIMQMRQVVQAPLTALPEADEEPHTVEVVSLPESSRSSPFLLPGSHQPDGEVAHPMACDLAEVIRPMLVSARAIAQDRQIHLQSHIPPNLPPIWGDPVALREALGNLLDNALKYTPSGGQVEVVLGLHRSDLTPNNRLSFQGIAILDTGPGISDADQGHLFERHFRGAMEQSDIPGTGLGLAITRDLIQQMQGHIELFSPAGRSGLLGDEVGSDRGTAFLVWLPEATDAAPQSE